MGGLEEKNENKMEETEAADDGREECCEGVEDRGFGNEGDDLLICFVQF